MDICHGQECTDASRVDLNAPPELNVNSVAALAATGGVPPYTFSIVDGPQHSGRGQIDAAGNYIAPNNPAVVTLRVSDSVGEYGDARVSVGSSRSWLVGGDDAYTTVNPEVLSITDGTTWVDEGPLGWLRTDAAMLVFRDALWLLGGDESNAGTALTDTVLRSADGVNWTAVGSLPEALEGGGVVAFGDRIWFAGGYKADRTTTSAVRSSADGLNWRDEAALPGARAHAVMLVFDERMWFLGGDQGGGVQSQNVYRSTSDGASWQDMGNLLPGPMLRGVGVVVDDQIWLGAGWTDTGQSAAAFVSADGLSWTAAVPLPLARIAPAATVTAGQILVVGGGPDYYLQPPGTNTWWLAPGAASWREGVLPAGVVSAALAAFRPP